MRSGRERERGGGGARDTIAPRAGVPSAPRAGVPSAPRAGGSQARCLPGKNLARVASWASNPSFGSPSGLILALGTTFRRAKSIPCPGSKDPLDSGCSSGLDRGLLASGATRHQIGPCHMHLMRVTCSAESRDARHDASKRQSGAHASRICRCCGTRRHIRDRSGSRRAAERPLCALDARRPAPARCRRQDAARAATRSRTPVPPPRRTCAGPSVERRLTWM
jgi:hypothetical protein